MKAMATDPKDRFPTVQALQDAIRAYEEHSESVALATRAQEELEHARQTDDYDGFS